MALRSVLEPWHEVLSSVEVNCDSSSLWLHVHSSKTGHAIIEALELLARLAMLSANGFYVAVGEIWNESVSADNKRSCSQPRVGIHIHAEHSALTRVHEFLAQVVNSNTRVSHAYKKARQTFKQARGCTTQYDSVPTADDENVVVGTIEHTGLRVTGRCTVLLPAWGPAWIQDADIVLSTGVEVPLNGCASIRRLEIASMNDSLYYVATLLTPSTLRLDIVHTDELDALANEFVSIEMPQSLECLELGIVCRYDGIDYLLAFLDTLDDSMHLLTQCLDVLLVHASELNGDAIETLTDALN